MSIRGLDRFFYLEHKDTDTNLVEGNKALLQTQSKEGDYLFIPRGDPFSLEGRIVKNWEPLDKSVKAEGFGSMKLTRSPDNVIGLENQLYELPEGFKGRVFVIFYSYHFSKEDQPANELQKQVSLLIRDLYFRFKKISPDSIEKSLSVERKGSKIQEAPKFYYLIHDIKEENQIKKNQKYLEKNSSEGDYIISPRGEPYSLEGRVQENWENPDLAETDNYPKGGKRGSFKLLISPDLANKLEERLKALKQEHQGKIFVVFQPSHFSGKVDSRSPLQDKIDFILTKAGFNFTKVP